MRPRAGRVAALRLGAGARWYVKKAARRGVALASFASGSLLVRDAAATGPRLRAITYHRFGDVPADPYCVSPVAFAAQMRWLAERGLLVSLDDALVEGCHVGGVGFGARHGENIRMWTGRFKGEEAPSPCPLSRGEGNIRRKLKRSTTRQDERGG